MPSKPVNAKKLRSIVLVVALSTFSIGFLIWQLIMMAEPAATESATVHVSITDQGLVPEVITVSVGTDVVWTNNKTVPVTIKNGLVYAIYLPIVVSNSTTKDTADGQISGAPGRAAYADFGNLLQPGESYTYTFTTPGAFPYYLDQLLGISGNVIVEEGEDPTATPTSTSTSTPTATPTSTPTSTPTPTPTSPPAVNFGSGNQQNRSWFMGFRRRGDNVYPCLYEQR